MRHVLIIEDHPLIALTIEDELRDCGFATADIAYTEESAIGMAEARCPDLITADQRLVQGSGINAIRHICREQAIPVLWITGVGLEIKAFAPNAVILEKPFSHRELCEAVIKAEKEACIYQ